MTLDSLFLDTPPVEWVGYIASVVVMISFLMSSIFKLRIINLIGAVLFAVYGCFIGSYPVCIVNVLIVIFNIYYLLKLRNIKEDFSIIEMTKGGVFLEKFLETNGKYIQQSFPDFKFEEEQEMIGFYILRNMTIAGIFIATPFDEKTLKVAIDYVVPQFRDFKVGLYIHHQLNKYFITKGYLKLLCETSNTKHIDYLERMGYDMIQEEGKISYLKNIGG